MDEPILETAAFEARLSSLVSSCGSNLGAEDFLAEVSETYHRLEADAYDDVHDEIIAAEAERFMRLARYAIESVGEGDLFVADIGCGTGHAALQFLSACARGSRHVELVCVDPSLAMLRRCERKVTALGYGEATFVHGDAMALRKDVDRRFDIILTSSVIHHLGNLDRFFAQMAGLLHPGAVWIMSHEPLGDEPGALARGVRFVHRAARVMQRRLSRRIWGKPSVSRGSPTTEHILDRVSSSLMTGGITPTRRLSRREVRALVDIHTPNRHPGDFKIGYDGFDLDKLSVQLKRQGLSGLHVERYGNLGTLGRSGFIGRGIERCLGAIDPESATIFSAVWRRSS